MKWSTQKIIKELRDVLPDDTIIAQEKNSQGEYYTRDILVFPEDEDVDDGDRIRIIGFITRGELSDIDEPSQDIPLVEVRNLHSDSRGGLSKKASPAIRTIYHAVVDYFNLTPGISVIDQLKDYF